MNMHHHIFLKHNHKAKPYDPFTGQKFEPEITKIHIRTCQNQGSEYLAQRRQAYGLYHKECLFPHWNIWAKVKLWPHEHQVCLKKKIFPKVPRKAVPTRLVLFMSRGKGADENLRWCCCSTAVTTAVVSGLALTLLPTVSLSCCPLSGRFLLCLNKSFSLKRMSKKQRSNDF